MKIILAICTAVFLLLTGFGASIKQKRITATLQEIVDFLCFVRTELQYRATDFETLLQIVNNENFKYIKQNDTSFFVSEIGDKNIIGLFEGFTKRFGTTDRDGQLSLCAEYLKKFRSILNEHQKNEKNKIQINTALSVFGALCIVILFI